MNIKNLVKVADSKQVKLADSRMRAALKQKLRARIMDTESTEDAAAASVEILKEEEPAEAISLVVEVLGDVIDDLQKSDSRKPRASKARIKALKDSLRSKIKDTESTDEVVEQAIEVLKDENPEDAIQVATEILGEVIDDLQDGQD